MELENDDKFIVKNIIDSYKKLHDELGQLENDLSSINHKKEITVNSILSTRTFEEAFTKTLEEKYGPGKLDVQTMKWIKL